MSHDVHIIGGGLAGSEAAWQLAEAGLKVRLSEMRGGGDMTPAHETDRLAEMVCSNSFRSDDAENNAVGLLHQEMRALGSLIMSAADQHRVPAGSALAVDREAFASEVSARIAAHPHIEVVRERVDSLPLSGSTIVATGPLTAPGLADAIAKVTGSDALAFFDAIAPIVHRDSIDMDVCWMAARWDKGGKDYINCPMDKAQYEAFVAALNEGEKTEFKQWEKDTPLLRRLHADRGDGVARRRNAALWPDEGRRSRRSAHRPLALCGGPASPGQCARHLVEHGRLPDQAEAWRAGPHLPHHSRPGKCRIRPPRRNTPQQLHPVAGTARQRASPEGNAPYPLRRPDHRLRRLCRKRRDRPARRPFRGSRSAGPRPFRSASRDRAGRAARPHHGRRRRGNLSTHERQFRPDAADRGP